MTDRELLELAAKAAGWSYWDDLAGNGYLNVYDKTGRHDVFNPLDDDGDALRLAVRLRKMPVIERWSDGHDWVFIPGHEGGALPLGDDPLAATRRAIVRAAAEIGGSKE